MTTEEKLIEVKPKKTDELPQKELYTNSQKILSEFIGTFLLVFVSCGSGVFSNADLVTGCLAGALTVFFLAFSLTKISGCLINPSITINFHIRGQINFILTISFVVAQCLGSLTGAFLLGIIKGNFTNVGSTKIGKMLLKDGKLNFRSYIMGLFCEIVFTAILSFVVSAAGDKNFKYQDKGPFMIAAYVFAISASACYLTGPSMNPARSLGPAVVEFFVGNEEALYQMWVYTFGPITGAIVGNTIYNMIGLTK